MKKRIFSALLALIMAIALFPMAALAAATGTYAVNLEVSNNTETSEIEVAMTVESEALTLKNMQSVVFVYDTSVLTPVLNGDAVKCVAASGWNVKSVKNTISESGKYGYIVLQPYTTSATACADAITLATVYFELVSDKTISDITSASIRYASLEDAEALKASAVVTVTNGSVSQYYLPSDTIQSPTLLGIDPGVKWNFETTTSTIAGTAILNGDMVYGQEITAVVEDGNVANKDILSYKWTRGGVEIADATGDSYVLTADDISKVINVEISADGYEGTLVSTNDIAVDKATVDAPYPVQLASTGETYFTIDEYNSAYEYACIPSETELEDDDFKTYTDGLISDLTPETAYDLYARVAETATTHVSEASPLETQSTAGHRFATKYTYDETQHWKECANSGCDEITAKENHDIIEFVDPDFLKSEATCDAPATYYKVCAICGYLSDETFTVGEALGHDYGDAWTKLDDDYHQKICANDPTHIEKANHNWDAGKVTTPATCTSTGVRTYTCADCSATKTETIPALAHSYSATTHRCTSCSKIDPSYTGLIDEGNDKIYVVNGEKQATTGMIKMPADSLYYASTYVYVKDGVLLTTYTGLAENSYGTWYIKEGICTQKETGMVKMPADSLYYASTYVYIKNNKLQTSYTGLAKNSYGTWYIKNGICTQKETGMIKMPSGSLYYANTYVYVKNNKLQTSYTGLAKNSYGTWYIKNGVCDQKTTGMIKMPSGSQYYASTYVYVKNNKLQTSYTGLAKNSYGTWYIKNGICDQKTTGVFKMPSNSLYQQNKQVYVKNSKWQSSYSGKVTYNKVKYKVTKGIAKKA